MNGIGIECPINPISDQCPGLTMEPAYEYSDAGYPVKEPVSYFAMLMREPNKIRLINVGPELVQAIQERLEQLVTVESFGYVIFKDYLQTSFTGRFNIYDLILEKSFFEKPEEDSKCPCVSKEDMTLIKVAFCRVLGTLFCYGYDIVVSSDLARDSMTHSAVFFRLRDPRRDLFPVHYYSHKFICVAPYGIDSILLINIPKVAVEPILKVRYLQSQSSSPFSFPFPSKSSLKCQSNSKFKDTIPPPHLSATDF